MAYSNYRGDWNRDRNERSRGIGGRDRDQQQWQSDEGRDIDDSRRARESMARDYYGSEGRGGYGGSSGRGGSEDQGSRYAQDYNQGGQDYSQRGYGQRDHDQEFGQGGGGQGGRFSESGYGRGREYLGGGEGRRHYGNEMGGWQGREREQWRNRAAHGDYDREANYGGYSSSGTGNYAGYGGSGGSYQGGGQGSRPGSYGQGGGYGQRYSQGGFGQGGYGQRGYGQSSFGQGGYGQGGSGRPSGGAAYGNYGGGMGYGDEYGSRYGSPGQGRGQWGSSQEQEFGQHRGRGPRGYRRSDDRIKEEVCDCLTDDDRLDATNIEINVKDGEVTLSGFVTNREDKRWAETLAERISGVKEVQNSLRVQDQQRGQGGTSASSGASATGGTATGTSVTGGAASAGKGKDLQQDKGKDIQH